MFEMGKKGKNRSAQWRKKKAAANSWRECNISSMKEDRGNGCRDGKYC